jgi:hypothetical protein
VLTKNLIKTQINGNINSHSENISTQFERPHQVVSKLFPTNKRKEQ